MTNPRSGPDEESNPVTAWLPSMKERKVVVKLRSGEVVKGHFILPGTAAAADPFCDWNQTRQTAITVRLLNSNAPMQIALNDVKAVFFVKSFRGDSKRKNLRFYTNGPAVGTIWAEIRFKDNEIIEAIIENSAQHLMGDGFMLRPSDADSNNTLVYINKSAIANYRVLGVRAHREPNA
jgi:hypothetical protein